MRFHRSPSRYIQSSPFKQFDQLMVAGGVFRRADGGDSWWRHLLRPNELPSKIDKAKYIETRLRVPEEARPWGQELSGRVASLAESLSRFALSEADRLNEISRARGTKPNADFRGFYFGLVGEVRALPHWDVYVESTNTDPAHSNLVVDAESLDSEDKVDYSVLETLLPMIEFYLPDSDRLTELEATLG
jgi:hypothetical protein